MFMKVFHVTTLLIFAVLYLWLLLCAKSKRCIKSKIFNTSSFNFQNLCTLLVFSYIFFLQSPHLLTGDLKGITFAMIAVHEQVALMSSSQRKTSLLLNVLGQSAMSLHLFVFYYIISADTTMCKQKALLKVKSI